MTRRDELEIVLRLACLTEDRTPDEQRAMLSTALMLDGDRATFSRAVGAPPPRFPELVRIVEATYDPSDGGQQMALDGEGPPVRRVGLTAQQRDTLGRLERRFDVCEKCGVVRGYHAAECLQRDLARHAKKATR